MIGPVDNPGGIKIVGAQIEAIASAAGLRFLVWQPNPEGPSDFASNSTDTELRDAVLGLLADSRLDHITMLRGMSSVGARLQAIETAIAEMSRAVRDHLGRIESFPPSIS